jgi:CheY-like chemotaxis protein
MPASKTALVLLNDLMFRVKIEGAMKQAGYGVSFTASPEDLRSAIGEHNPNLVIIDLNFTAASPINLIEQLKANPKTSAVPLLGYVSHVQTDLKDAALQKGCDRVVARSVLSDRLAQLLAEFTTGTAF